MPLIKPYPKDHGTRVRLGRKEGQKRREYFMLGCPVPPPSRFDQSRKQLQDSISKDEVILHLLKNKAL